MERKKDRLAFERGEGGVYSKVHVQGEKRGGLSKRKREKGGDGGGTRRDGQQEAGQVLVRVVYGKVGM